MIIGDLLLSDLNITLNDLTHKKFEEVRIYFETNKESLFQRANEKLIEALAKLYPVPNDYANIDRRRLSATFRRGDLLLYL